jgi:hypothetical protein
MESRSSWLAWQMIRISASKNYTLWRICNGMTITNTLSNTESLDIIKTTRWLMWKRA